MARCPDCGDNMELVYTFYAKDVGAWVDVYVCTTCHKEHLRISKNQNPD